MTNGFCLQQVHNLLITSNLFSLDLFLIYRKWFPVSLPQLLYDINDVSLALFVIPFGALHMLSAVTRPACASTAGLEGFHLDAAQLLFMLSSSSK